MTATASFLRSNIVNWWGGL